MGSVRDGRIANRYASRSEGPSAFRLWGFRVFRAIWRELIATLRETPRYTRALSVIVRVTVSRGDEGFIERWTCRESIRCCRKPSAWRNAPSLSRTHVPHSHASRVYNYTWDRIRRPFGTWVEFEKKNRLYQLTSAIVLVEFIRKYIDSENEIDFTNIGGR